MRCGYHCDQDYNRVRRMKKETIRIEGMGCAHCVGAVRSALAGIPGVVVHEVSIGAASVEIGSDAILQFAVQAINQAGYTVRPSGTESGNE